LQEFLVKETSVSAFGYDERYIQDRERTKVKFFVIGDVTVDHIHFLERIPSAGEDATPLRSALLPGGAGGTLAYYAARLGHEVRLAARVGNDPFRQVALGNLERGNVKLDAVQTDPNLMTGTITILVTPSAERTMISATGANRHLDAADLDRKALETSDALVVSAYALMAGMQREYTIKAIDAAKKARVPVFIDLGTGAVNAAGTKLLESVKAADYLLMNQLELFRITGQSSISEALAGLKAQGLKTVVIKVGALGAILWTPTESELLEGFEIDGVADTTGAGDGFTAAFAHAVLSGYDLPRAVRYANIAGALVATSIGAQGSLLTHADILERLEDSSAPRATLEVKPVAVKEPAKKPRAAKLEAVPMEAAPLEPVVVEAAPVKRTRKKA
jgi:ribokinase